MLREFLMAFQDRVDGTLAREHQQGWLVLSGWDAQEENVGRSKASILPSVTLPESTDDTISFPLTTYHLGGAEEMDGNQKGEVLLKKV